MLAIMTRHQRASRILSALLVMLLLAAGEARLSAYQEPKTANIRFNPAGIVLDPPMADRLPVLLIGLATDYPQVSDRQKAAALAITMALHPDSMAAQAANRDLANGVKPDGMNLAISLSEAIAELRTCAVKIHEEALSEDERALGLCLMAVHLIFQPKHNPDPGDKLPLSREEGEKLLKPVLSGS
jgi:hypothetical protein